MTPEQKELFRLALLRVLDANASETFGLRQNAIQSFLVMQGFRNAPADDVRAELAYLEDKRFVARVGKQISPENTCWRITADGRDFLAQQ